MSVIMKAKYIIFVLLPSMFSYIAADAQYRETDKDSSYVSIQGSSEVFPRQIRNVLPSSLFIPGDRLAGLTPWMGGPITRPVVHIMPVFGFNGYGFGKFYVDHWDKFFANLLSYNQVNVPQVYDRQVMMVGNTIALGKKRRLYFANGILYGRDYGVWGNMIGMGSREGLIYRPNGYVILNIWTQEYQSVSAFSPVVYADPGKGTAAMKLPASPVIVSYGAQAYFLAGQFWIGLGATFWHAAKPER
jgi:hypothetical protein